MQQEGSLFCWALPPLIFVFIRHHWLNWFEGEINIIPCGLLCSKHWHNSHHQQQDLHPQGGFMKKEILTPLLAFHCWIRARAFQFIENYRSRNDLCFCCGQLLSGNSCQLNDLVCCLCPTRQRLMGFLLTARQAFHRLHFEQSLAQSTHLWLPPVHPMPI
jgi:hypothetical protein